MERYTRADTMSFLLAYNHSCTTMKRLVTYYIYYFSPENVQPKGCIQCIGVKIYLFFALAALLTCLEKLMVSTAGYTEASPPQVSEFPGPPGTECSGLCDVLGHVDLPEDSPTKQFYKGKVFASQEEITQLKKKVTTLQQT
ncbi:hypothetical protein HPB48_016465 [Haemaphysalis longicornis]|uniref:Uncharacterized protein n=1 Tax=Haemaphysalis longicornis TaxID=44386 RepID=A0A9J6GWT4_HAELO|nr:hypothetical protein HPB48_016465 [Haemaphysalis longicornis]